MKRAKQKVANRAKPKKASLVRIEPDVAKDVSIESKRNGRTVQGEVNSVLRDHYASKWDAPASVTTAQGVRSHTGQWHESPSIGAGVKF